MRTAQLRLVLVAAAVAILAPVAYPWLQNTTGTGAGTRWTSMPVTIVINSAGSDNVAGTADDDAIRAALTSLQAITSAIVAFNENTNATERARTDFNSSNIHLYVFDETGWSGLFGSSRSGAVAITPYSFQLNGSIISADVVYNGRDFTFSTDGSGGSVDIRSVTTHETEHFLGFDHTGDYTASLFPVTFDNVTRTPAPDDVAGLSTVYPEANYNTTFGSLSGSVRTSGASAARGAQVVASNTDGMVTATAYTDASGNFTVRGLVPGGYTLYAEPIDGPLYPGSVGLDVIDTNFGTAFLGGNTTPTVVTVVAGQTVAAGQITVGAATTINITSGTPVRATRGQTLSVWLSGTAINTATNVSIPGNGVTITTAQILSASQARLDLTIAANAPLGSRTMFLWVTNGGDNTALTGGLDIQDASGNSVTYPGAGGGPTPPSITTTTLPNGQVGVAYNQTLAATGGTTPYTWSLSAGSLPTGLTLAAGTGLISGTPTATGTFNFTARVTDANSLSATRALSITIDVATLTITTTSLANGQVGVAYSRTLAAAGGSTPYTWSLASGSLPTGLSLGASTGAITGTPTAAGTSSFTVRVTDSASRTDTQALSITIDAATLNITTTSLASGQVSVNYSQGLGATGGSTPYTWSLASGSLPTGLSLNASTGAITGTPTTAGTYNFTVRVTDSASRTDTQALSITINASTLSITTSSLPNGRTGTAYSQTLAATGGTTPYTWSLASGTLPAGMTLAASTGVISGTPTTVGTATFTARVTDAASRTATRSLSITVDSGVTPTPGAEIVFGFGPYPARGGFVETRNDVTAAYSHLGWPRIDNAAYNSANGETRTAVGDVDGDGKAELLIGMGRYTAGGGFVAVLDDALRGHALLRWLQIPSAAYNAANGETWPACGDTDGDGRAEIFIGQGTYTAAGGYVYAFDDASASYAYLRVVRLPWVGYNSANGAVHPACGDVDGDGRAELLLGQGTSGPGLAGGYVAVMEDAAGSYAWRQWIRTPSTPYNAANGLTRPACGDVDGDGRAEVLIGMGQYTSAGGYVWVCDDANAGHAVLRTLRVPWAAYNGANGETRPAVGDIDNDGRAEIVCGLGTYAVTGGYVYVWNDAAANYGALTWLRNQFTPYNAVDGQTWPSVGDIR